MKNAEKRKWRKMGSGIILLNKKYPASQVMLG